MGFPGLADRKFQETIASTTTIAPQSDCVRITGTTAIATITPPQNGGWSQQLTLIPIGLFTTVTTGNIALATTTTTGKALIMTYSFTDSKWYPSY